MRKIEREMIQAIIDRRDWHKANTEVEIYPSFAMIMLHGHEIGKYYFKDSTLLITNCGYETNTTKSRLNALINLSHGGLVGVVQRNFNWFIRYHFNGSYRLFDWDGGWLNVEPSWLASGLA